MKIEPHELHVMVMVFVHHWGPSDMDDVHKFIEDLRALLEAYGKAALLHRSLPDSEHGHGEPVITRSQLSDLIRGVLESSGQIAADGRVNAPAQEVTGLVAEWLDRTGYIPCRPGEPV